MDREAERSERGAGATRVHEDEVVNVEDGDRCVRIQCSRLVCSTGLMVWACGCILISSIRLSLCVTLLVTLVFNTRGTQPRNTLHDYSYTCMHPVG
jgi:hypothetical protein